jgi:hypothetical protein
MSNARYYVVGDRDMWMINVKESESNPCACRNQALAFALGAAQRLGMRGERAHICEVDGDGRFRCKWTYDRTHRLCRKVS